WVYPTLVADGAEEARHGQSSTSARISLASRAIFWCSLFPRAIFSLCWSVIRQGRGSRSHARRTEAAIFALCCIVFRSPRRRRFAAAIRSRASGVRWSRGGIASRRQAQLDRRRRPLRLRRRRPLRAALASLARAGGASASSSTRPASTMQRASHPLQRAWHV